MRGSYEFNVWADNLDAAVAQAGIIAARYFGGWPFDIESIDADADAYLGSGEVALVRARVRARAHASE